MNSLSNAELNILIKKCRDGDESAFSCLVELYAPLMNGIIEDYSMDRDEHFSDACMALYRAALSYDIRKGDVTFGLYAKVCITNRLTDIYRSEKSRKNKLLADVDVDTIPVSDGTHDRLVKQEEREAFCCRAKEVLSDYEYRIMLLWMRGYSSCAVAKELDVSQKSVDNAKSRILKKLREALASE